MRRLVVLVAGLLLVAGCGATPITETHTVLYQIKTINPTTYAAIRAYYAMVPLADHRAKVYDISWKQEATVHYPDVTRVALTGEIDLSGTLLVPNPAAENADLECQIWVDGVLVAEDQAKAVSCVHTMVPGKQPRYVAP